MLDTFRPQLKPNATFRKRSDGSAGVWDPSSGHALEVAADEAQLLDQLDGRSLSEICAAHARDHGFVPFTALRDLLYSLGRVGLLANPERELAEAGLVERRTLWQKLADQELFGVPLPSAAGSALSLVGSLALIGLAVWGFGLAERPPRPLDVLWAGAGASLALSGRALVKSAVGALFGKGPQRLECSVTLGIVHIEPDMGGAVLLDRVPRALSLLGALLGSTLALLACFSQPGLAFGAAAVLMGDLCPFEPTSAGKLLAVFSGKVDLREHARAYLQRRLLTRAISSQVFDGEIVLVYSLLLSLGWFSLLIQVLFSRGLLAALMLLSLALDSTQGAVEHALSAVGAVGVALSMPASVVALLYALIKAALSLRPPRENHAGQQTGHALQTVDLAAIPIFSHLGPEHLEQLSKVVKEIQYPAGAKVVTQGEAGDRFFAIRSGEVAVERESESGLAREIAHLGPGDCFGETALLDKVPRTASVRAVTPTTVAVLSSGDFEKVRAQLADVDLTRLLRAAAALHRSRFFAKLPAERLSSLALKLQPREVTAGATVVRAGDAGSEFYLVGSGKLEVLDPQGQRVGELGPGDHFGEIALLRDVPRTATVRATADALLMALPKESFIRALASDLTLSARLEELAAERAEETLR